MTAAPTGGTMACLWYSQVRHGLPRDVLFVMSSAVSATEPDAVVATLRQIAEHIPRLRAQGSRVSAQDTKRVLITPAIAAPGWDTLASVFGDRRPQDSLPDDLLLRPSVSQSCIPGRASGAGRAAPDSARWTPPSGAAGRRPARPVADAASHGEAQPTCLPEKPENPGTQRGVRPAGKQDDRGTGGLCRPPQPTVTPNYAAAPDGARGAVIRRPGRPTLRPRVRPCLEPCCRAGGAGPAARGSRAPLRA